MEEKPEDLEKNREVIQQDQQQCQQLSTECEELSTMANQICDGMTQTAAADQSQQPDGVAVVTPEVSASNPADAADQSQSPDSVAVTTTEASPATGEVSAPNPASVDEQSSSEIAQPTRLRENIVGENGVVITPEEMDMAQLKVQVVCQEKANMALRMELKCAELQVAAKEKIDAKKTRLVELLDAKLAQVEKKNLQLVEMITDGQGERTPLKTNDRSDQEPGGSWAQTCRERAGENPTEVDEQPTEDDAGEHGREGYEDSSVGQGESVEVQRGEREDAAAAGSDKDRCCC